MIMYYVEVVPTDIETFASHVKTYQYSVKENVRKIGKFNEKLFYDFFYHKYLFFRSRSWIAWNARNLSQIRHECIKSSSAVGSREYRQIIDSLMLGHRRNNCNLGIHQQRPSKDLGGLSAYIRTASLRNESRKAAFVARSTKDGQHLRRSHEIQQRISQ